MPPLSLRRSFLRRWQRLWFETIDAAVYPLYDIWQAIWQRSRQATAADAVINQKVIRVVGMRRTGNHALLSWIKQQLPGTYAHLNNIGIDKNPYRHKADNLKRYYPEHDKMSQAYRRQANGDLIRRDCLLYSYEDWSLTDIVGSRVERKRTLYLGQSDQCLDVLILRDPFNLFASRLKKNYVATKAKRFSQALSMVDMWLEYAREFVGESHYLKRNLICINYNRWFADESYRRQLATRLGVPFSDAGLTSVPDLGGGSSFDGLALNGQASAMDVTNRWQQFANDPAFRQLFSNDAIWYYSERIFGELPGTNALRDRRRQATGGAGYFDRRETADATQVSA